MYVWVLIGVGLAVGGTIAFFAKGNRSTAKAHAAFSRGDVVSALTNALDEDDSAWHDEFDLFLAWPMTDRYLEGVRQRCLTIVRTSGTPAPGQDLSDEARRKLAEILKELHG